MCTGRAHLVVGGASLVQLVRDDDRRPKVATALKQVERMLQRTIFYAEMWFCGNLGTKWPVRLPRAADRGA